MSFKTTYVLLGLLAGFLLLNSCVSSSKFKAAQVKIDSLAEANAKLTKSITANSALERQTIATIPNSPPRPSSEMELTCPALKNCTTYKEVDNILRAAFDANHEEKYYFNFDGGFALATPLESIDQNGKTTGNAAPRTDQESWLGNAFKGIGGFGAKIFNTTYEYHRFIIIIVSPNIYKIGGSTLTQQEFGSWFVDQYVRLPNLISGRPLPNGTIFYALLYEFKKNDTQGSDFRQTFQNDCVVKLGNSPLISAICNYQKHGKD